VLVVVFLSLAVSPIEEPNRPDVARANPPLVQLVRSEAHVTISCINRLAGRYQREMAVPRLTVVRKVA
jgi:hypothetical protein